jgi:hypothetical protein
MPVTRADWKNSPLPEKRARLEISRAFAPVQIERIHQGLLPESQDDRWFMFYEHYRLYIHRSWTGHCIYIAYFRAENGLWILTHADARALAALVSSLLGEPHEYVDPAIPTELQSVFRWTFFGQQFTDDKA